MVSEARLTDEVIDSLSGRELDEAVCLAAGWTIESDSLFRSPGGFVRGRYELPSHKSDLGSAMGLLLSFDNRDVRLAVNCSIEESIQVFASYGSQSRCYIVASGPKDQAATVICRAFLKLKNRS